MSVRDGQQDRAVTGKLTFALCRRVTLRLAIAGAGAAERAWFFQGFHK